MEVHIPSCLEIGSITYRIESGPEAVKYLETKGLFGAQSANEGWIRLDGASHRVAETFLHEVIHCVNYELAHNVLKEEDVSSIATGLSQVLKQVGIEFVLKEELLVHPTIRPIPTRT